MAFIETHQSLRDHRKILTMATELDMPEAHVAGHCVFLWLWSIDNAEDGILPASERMIERAAGWYGTPGQLVAAMVNASMLDRMEDGSLRIHDWMDYAGRLIEKRHENAARMREARAAKASGTSNKRATHVQRTSPARAGATQQYTTTQYTTEAEENVPTERGASAPLAQDTLPVDKPATNGHKSSLPERRDSDTTDRAYWERILKEAPANQRTALLVRLAHEKIGADDTPGGSSYARLGKMAKDYHGAGLVATWILQAATEHIAGDPLDYLTVLAKKQTNRASQNGRTRAATPANREPVYATADQAAPKGWE